MSNCDKNTTAENTGWAHWTKWNFERLELDITPKLLRRRYCKVDHVCTIMEKQDGFCNDKIFDGNSQQCQYERDFDTTCNVKIIE